MADLVHLAGSAIEPRTDGRYSRSGAGLYAGGLPGQRCDCSQSVPADGAIVQRGSDSHGLAYLWHGSLVRGRDHPAGSIISGNIARRPGAGDQHDAAAVQPMATGSPGPQIDSFRSHTTPFLRSATSAALPGTDPGISRVVGHRI